MTLSLPKRTVKLHKRQLHPQSRGRVSRVGQLRMNSLEALDAPPEVIDFFRKMDRIKVTPVESEASELLDKYGVKWTAQAMEWFMRSR